MIRSTVWRTLRDRAATAPTSPAVSVRGQTGQWRTLTWRDFVDLVDFRAARSTGVRVGARDAVLVEEPNGPEFLASVVAAWAVGRSPLVVPHGIPENERAALLGKLHATGGAFDGGAETADGSEPDLAWFFPSGGTTGLPTLTPVRGLPRDLVASQQMLLSQMRWKPEGTQLVMGPLSHTAPFTSALAGLAGGNHVVVLQRWSLPAVLDAARRYPPTWFQTTPHQMSMIAAHEPAFTALVARLDGMMHTAAPCPEKVKAVWMDRIGPERVYELYGSTQMVGAVFCSGEQWLAHPGTVGRPFMTQVRVVDQRGRRLPPGQVGEIYLRSAATQRLQPAQLRHVRTLPGGFCSVGDLGNVDADGYLYLTDRVDDVIIVGGANVSTREIEAVLLRHPRVTDTVVVGRADSLLGMVPAAVIVADNAGPAPGIPDIQAHCRASLSAHKVPVHVEFVPAIERSPAGKVQRFKYRDHDDAGRRDPAPRR
ncbi:class I adenylate-forming enzyme family protein [Actinoplanes derwentensis]|uniref:Bile acid-coenzyme A ligase n=1 Tax=Actinoplanes derwentensis TaxID=113562 RepID=A0A1H2DDK6_9ACTN|nr:AMP-binding protein [Actinoplanes derwentensis]GID89970.1 putative acid-CoA ligase [Actinoplanes derwentensis]SDT80582.1 bile acid-coenzyme A ligase [Actinoplanes derwentensis]